MFYEWQIFTVFNIMLQSLMEVTVVPSTNQGCHDVIITNKCSLSEHKSLQKPFQPKLLNDSVYIYIYIYIYTVYFF